jgi:hypothetical protein
MPAASVVDRGRPQAQADFWNPTARRGGKRAQTAVAHCLLVAAWHVLATRTPYQVNLEPRAA